MKSEEEKVLNYSLNKERVKEGESNNRMVVNLWWEGKRRGKGMNNTDGAGDISSSSLLLEAILYLDYLNS